MDRIVQMVSHMGRLIALDEHGRLWEFRLDRLASDGYWFLLSEGPRT